jgi:putative sigma-54 modulation protein
MTIEFHSPHGKVKEWIVDYMKSKLIELHHLEPAISRAEVYLKEEPGVSAESKICEIDLTIFGESLFVRRSAGSFEEASREALDSLTADMQSQVGRRNEPPDRITSTVKV